MLSIIGRYGDSRPRLMSSMCDSVWYYCFLEWLFTSPISKTKPENSSPSLATMVRSVPRVVGLVTFWKNSLTSRRVTQHAQKVPAIAGVMIIAFIDQRHNEVKSKGKH